MIKHGPAKHLIVLCFFSMFSKVAIKIIDKTQLNPSSLQKVSLIYPDVLRKYFRCKLYSFALRLEVCPCNYVFESDIEAFELF